MPIELASRPGSVCPRTARSQQLDRAGIRNPAVFAVFNWPDLVQVLNENVDNEVREVLILEPPSRGSRSVAAATRRRWWRSASACRASCRVRLLGESRGAGCRAAGGDGRE